MSRSPLTTQLDVLNESSSCCETATDTVIPLAASVCNSSSSASAVIPKAFVANFTVSYYHHYARIPKSGPVVTSFNGYIPRSLRLGRAQVAHVAHKEKQPSSSHISWSQNTMWSLYLLAFIFYLASQPSMIVCSSSIQEQKNKNDLDSTCRRPIDRSKSFAFTPNRLRYNNEEHLIIVCSTSKARKVHKCRNSNWEPPLDWLSECPPSDKTCPPIKPVENGYFTPSNSTFAFASKVNFTCHKGYQLVGAQILICDVGLKWSFKPPICNSLATGAGPRSHSYILIFSILASIFSIIIISAMVFSAYQRRKRNKMQNQWRNYFSGYTYRASQRKITRRTPGDQQGTVYFTQEAAQITDL